MYGIADLDNCYVSCERVFRPDLKGVPCVVLSNNDGCVVARSNEAKAMGIKEGTPYFQLAQQFPGQRIEVFSSNYELYGEMTGRVVSIIRQEAPAYFRYSIDECFIYLPDRQCTMNNEPLELARFHQAKRLKECTKPGDNSQFSILNSQFLQHWGENLHKRVMREVGMPLSIGLAPNKTLAKIASKLAKKFEVYRHCCMIDTDYKREKALEWCPIEDVWGIGRRYAAKLQALGCKTALDFAKHHKDWVRLTFNNINIVRTWQELNGEDVVPNEELTKKKSICTSRSFNGMISDYDTLRTHVANYASRCAEKLRAQNTVASIVGVFIHTNAFREDLAQYWNFQETRLLTPTNSTIPIVQAANEVLQRMFIQGYQYKKAGVIVMGIAPDSPIQQDLFDSNPEKIQKLRRLDEAIDRINRINGSETIVVGAQQYTKKDGKGRADVFANAIKHDHRSPNPTTRWSDIMVLNHGEKKKEL